MELNYVMNAQQKQDKQSNRNYEQISYQVSLVFIHSFQLGHVVKHSKAGCRIVLI